MNKLIAAALLVFALLLAIAPGEAVAQQGAPSHCFPIGKGAGVGGWASTCPGTAGGIPISGGSTVDPAFRVPSGNCTFSSLGVVDCAGLRAANNTWTGNNFFGSGRPICDVRAAHGATPGAAGNFSTDDSAAFTACVTTLEPLGGGIVYISEGIYCVNSGVSTSTKPIQFVGAGAISTQLRICDGSDHTVVTINTTWSSISGLYIVGLNSTTATVPAVKVGTQCVDCLISNIYALQGSYAAIISGADTTVYKSKFESGFSQAQVLLNSVGAIYMIRDKTDQPWPNGQPLYGYTLNTWAATDATKCTVTAGVGSIMSLNGYYLQCLTAGTTGGTAPALPYAYQANITDGSAVWRLANPQVYSAVLLDGQIEGYLWGGDYSGSFRSGIRLIGGTNYTTIESATTGGYDSGIDAQNGSRLFVSSTTVGGCLTTGCTGINIGASFTGKNIISGNYIENVYQGIQVNTGSTKTIISNNDISSSGYGVLIQPNVVDFNITDNTFVSLNDITVLAGTSDYYVITGNLGHGIAVVDGAGGAHSTVANNW